MGFITWLFTSVCTFIASVFFLYRGAFGHCMPFRRFVLTQVCSVESSLFSWGWKQNFWTGHTDSLRTKTLRLYFCSFKFKTKKEQIYRYPSCPYNCPPPRENKEKKNSKIQKIQKIQKNFFFAFFGGPHKFVEKRQIYRKDFKIYKRSIICYEI